MAQGDEGWDGKSDRIGQRDRDSMEGKDTGHGVMEQGWEMWDRGTWSRGTKGYGMGVWSGVMDLGVRESWGRWCHRRCYRAVSVPGR